MPDEVLRRIGNEPILIAVYRYWDGKRNGRRMPDRQDFDPTELPAMVLPHLSLIEITEEGRLKLRLVGTEIVRQHGRDNTGRFADEYLKGEYLAYLQGLYLQLHEMGCPIYAESRFRHPENQVDTVRLILPMSWGGPEVRIALLAQTFHYARDRLGTPITKPLDAGTLEVLSQWLVDPDASDDAGSRGA